MRRYSSLGCVAVCLALVLNAAAVAAPTRTIVVLGDSLSAAFGMEVRAGWPMLLQQRLQQQQLDYRVVNASIGGDTTGTGLARLPALLEKHRPAIVIIALGGNDGLRGQPPPQIKHNIGAMIAKARGAGAQVLLVGVPLPPNYGKRYTDRFSQIYREAALEHHAPLVPFILEGVAVSGNRELMQADGIHPTAQAQARMLENVWSQLKLLL